MIHLSVKSRSELALNENGLLRNIDILPLEREQFRNSQTECCINENHHVEYIREICSDRLELIDGDLLNLFLPF